MASELYSSFKSFVKGESKDDQEARSLVENKFKKYDADAATRLVRYRMLQNFFKGKQWGNQIYDQSDSYVRSRSDYGLLYSGARPDGMAQITYNKCGPATEKFHQFLSIEQLEFHVPKPKTMGDTLETYEEQAQNPIKDSPEAQRVDMIEKLGKIVLYEENDFKTVTRQFTLDGAIFGDSFWQQYWDPQMNRIKIRRLDPYKVRAWFKDDTYSELAGSIYCYQVDLETAKRPIEDGGLNDGGKLDGLVAEQPKYGEHIPQTEQDMVNVYDYWEDLSKTDSKGMMKPKCRNIVIVGEVVVKDEIIKDPFPVYHAKTIEVPNEPYGTSFAAPALTIQREINERLSDEADIIHMYASPWILDMNSGQDPNDIIGSPQGPKIIPIQEGGDMKFLEWSGRIYPVSEHIRLLNKAFDDVIGMPAIAYGVIDASLATGVALTTSFQSTIKKIQSWSYNLGTQFRKQWKDMMILIENHQGAEGKNIIQGHYEVKLEWGERAPRDESIFMTNVINQKNAGLMSDYSAMEKLGVTSPQDERIEIAREKNNPYYNPEIAMQKLQAYMQLSQTQQQLQQMKAPVEQGAAPLPGQPTAAGSESPNLPPNMQNVPQPMAQPGEGGGSYQQPVPGPKEE